MPPLVILGVRRVGLEAGTALVVAIVVMLPPLAWLAALRLASLLRLTRALEGAALSYRDGGFSLNLAPDGPRELSSLTRLHAEMGLDFTAVIAPLPEALREALAHSAAELARRGNTERLPQALVREIAEAHDGRIALGNREGGGLRGVLSLPRSAGPPAR